MHPHRTPEEGRAAALGRRALVGGAALAALTSAGAGRAAATSTPTATDGAWVPVPVPEQVPVTEHRVPVAGDGTLWCWDTGGRGRPVVLCHPGSG